jgi:thiol:disulfide interchange protein DsbD
MVSVLLLIFLGISVGAWLAGPVAERARFDVKRIRVRRVGVAVALLSALGVWALRGPATDRSDDHRYSQAKADSLLAEGRPVFVDFTAAWCITCQVNERTTLSSSKVREAFRKRNVAVLVADWTNRDPDITRALEQFGRNGVPLYVLYSARGRVEILPAVLTPDIVLKALDSLEQ